MASSKNREQESSGEATPDQKKKLKKFYPLEAGNTSGCHERIVRKLKKYGATDVSKDKSEVVVLFCPIVTRFETDINEALSSRLDDTSRSRKVILVAMHHTHKADYILPHRKRYNHNGAEGPVVHCLFHETKGFFRCSANKQAVRAIRREMGIRKFSDRNPFLKFKKDRTL